jgi:2-polyprenyl-3-methyl-5-hydroxy-6-metoxy-1,4-benzoquinol methylase
MADTAEAFGNLYYQGFESLQRCSDEKQVYIAKFSEYIERYEVDSLLDIGAGNGEVAVPISEQVGVYVAVEQDPKYAAMLQNAGKKVVEQAFPVEVQGSYDLVVMSHIISNISGNYATLVPPAWELVRPDGHLLVVTHRGTEQDDWNQLLDFVGLGYSERSTARIIDLVASLQERGKTEIQKITTTLRAADSTQMIEAMAFLASSGDEAKHGRFMEKAERVIQVLDKEYRTEDGFSFPLLHPFLSTQKSAS